MPRIKDFFQRYGLLVVVFLTGAAVLVIEVAATRILSIYFGNTIFTVSSVISVILLALSLGYFFGGRLADKRASEGLFYQIIALSGLSVFLLQMLNMLVIPLISNSLSLQSGPIITSIVLFLLPGFLLGMLSPLVVKLQTLRQQSLGIGQIAGDVFFWSTLGSIIGSLATGFFLIPTFGISQIIVGTGVLLLGIGLIGMATNQKTRFNKERIFVLMLLIPILQVGLVAVSSSIIQYGTVYAADGLYDSIVIYDNAVDGKNIRYLRQATDASSAMYLDSPELVYEYTKYFEVYKLSKPDIQHAMVIGGGAYSVPKALLKADNDVIVDVAEIEPSMFALAKDYFNVPNTPRLVNHVEDGRRVLAYSNKQYDVIFGDAFHTSIPAHLTTKEFFELTKSKLSPDGVFIMNTIGSLKDEKPSYLLSEIKTFTSIFKNYHVFGVYSATEPYAQNVMLVGYNTEKPIDLKAAPKDNKLLSSLSEKVVDVKRFDLSSHPTFTDDYAPIEYYNSVRELK